MYQIAAGQYMTTPQGQTTSELHLFGEEVVRKLYGWLNVTEKMKKGDRER
jgi:hypothetical protein